MGGMLNNTTVRVTYPLDELLGIAYQSLASRNLVPYTHPNVPIDYEARYHIKDKNGDIINGMDGMTVTFGLAPRKESKEESEPYKAGDWKDPEVDEIIEEEDHERATEQEST